MDVNDMYNEINLWAGETFGFDRDVFGVLEHMEEELGELHKAVKKFKDGWRDDKEDIMCEYADMQILLWNLMGRMGVCHNACMDAVVIKMAVNKKRKWEPVEGSKKIKHVAGTDPYKYQEDGKMLKSGLTVIPPVEDAVQCDVCQGTGEDDEYAECTNCGGTGKVGGEDKCDHPPEFVQAGHHPDQPSYCTKCGNEL